MKYSVKFGMGSVLLLMVCSWGCIHGESIPPGSWSSLEHSSSNWSELYQEKMSGTAAWSTDAKGNHGFTDQTVWLHRTVESLPSGEWVVDFSWAFIDEVELFLVDGSGNLLFTARGGSGLSYRDKVFPSKVVALPFELLSEREPGEVRHLFVALRSSNVILANPEIFWPSDYRNHVEENTVVDCLFFGTLFAFLLLILILGIGTKDRILLLFLLNHGTSGIWLLGFSGLGYAYLWPNLPAIHPGAPYALNGIFLSLWGVFAALFYESYLQLEKRNRPAFLCMKIFRYLVGALIPFWFWAPSWSVVHDVVSFLGLWGFILFAVLVYECWRGSQEAWLLSVGALWSCLLLVFIASSNLMGYGESVLPAVRAFYAPHFIFGITITVFITKKINWERLQWRSAEKTQELLRQRLAVAQALVLGRQMSPHFLANQLNDVAYWVGENPDRANQHLKDLADFYRVLMTYCTKPIVPVEEERRVLEQYLSINRQEYERYTINLDFDLDEATEIPSMVIQPLLENAIKHGMELRRDGCEISARVSQGEGRICIEINDNGSGMGGKDAESFFQLGHALHNVRDRLALLYDGQGEIDVRDREEGGLSILLSFPS